jgi:hypothetical protein
MRNRRGRLVPVDTEMPGDADYLLVWHNLVLPLAYEFEPELIIVSAGFDAADGDPMGGCPCSHLLAEMECMVGCEHVSTNPLDARVARCSSLCMIASLLCCHMVDRLSNIHCSYAIAADHARCLHSLPCPAGQCHVTPACFGHLTALLRPVARLALLLEGGYNLEATAAGAEACLRALLGQRPRHLPGGR